MDLLFQPFTLRDLTLPNRIVVSPMAQYSAGNDGHVTDWHLMHYGTFAASGAGLTVLEATAVLPEGRVSPNCLGVWDDAHIAGLKRVVDFFRRPAGGMVGIQLAHAGRKASVAPPWTGVDALTSKDGGWAIWGASDCPYPGREAPIAPSPADLERIADAYVAAVGRADQAGFDLIELHCAHGYFLNNFLSPLSNTRQDEWGGDREGRMRYPLEIFRRLRAAWPAGKPMGVRISATEWVENGWDLEDSVVFSQRLKDLGCDYVALSSGGTSPDQKIAVGPGYQVPFSEEVRRRSGIPTVAVGMLSDPQLANDVLEAGQADLIAIGRGMLFNPRWAWHAAAELQGTMRVPPPYLRCHPSMRNLPR
ncbi:NADH:flavin oxidoreductase/NADH oxidase [Enterovirga rhinocerotis]|uniref:2,4-dienoyl-CoA reductase-like NADH-dependent reductase (Old Yellow Enzyme family) n=1 Tax=Enterovirga rhinocerotis TaxID=1339210 RepID=A0A4R7C4K3_9HYPH|nr:NADH:flavin oxidoreductase/NADH oxidase [Enterovirga rhinocerotis]TDR93308.1 2,4-dienoyl-CoA reductase-like NADH-dependent reductase (Old Yellow Enzyme family) [Enterovirga rhinocerotis]